MGSFGFPRLADLDFAGQFDTGVYPGEWYWREGMSLPDVTRHMANARKADLSVARLALSEDLGRAAARLAGWSGARLGQDTIWWKAPKTKPIAHRQDAIEVPECAQDIGAGMGALLVLRLVGGASGATLAGAIIASGFVALRHTAGGTAPLAANSLHHGAPALADLGGSGLAVAGADLGWSFAMVYATAAVLAGIAFFVTPWMPNTRLRESLHAVPISE